MADAPDGWKKKTITDANGTRTVLVPEIDPNARRKPGRGRGPVVPSSERRAHNPGLLVPGPRVRRGRAVPMGKAASKLRAVLGEHALRCIASWKGDHPDGAVEVDWGNRRVVFQRTLGGQDFVAGYPFSEIVREVTMKGGTPGAFRRCVDRDLEDARWAKQGPPEEGSE